jgi:hypothetical protein
LTLYNFPKVLALPRILDPKKTGSPGGAQSQRSGSIVMSIFKKKGTVESLFRIGAGDDEAGAKGAAAGAADDVNKHEVYYVRGRPFIAPTKTGARSAPRGRGTPWRLRQQSGRITETRGSRRAQLRI